MTFDDENIRDCVSLNAVEFTGVLLRSVALESALDERR
jgi:hypothetical protein